MFGKKAAFYGTALLLAGLFCAGCTDNHGKKEINATGTIEMTEVTVGTKIGGRILRIRVQEGQEVKKGDLLAELEHEELNAQISAAQANLDAAVARLKKARAALSSSGAEADKDAATVREAQVEMAENNLAAAKANLEAAEKDLFRMEELYKSELISKAQHEQAQIRERVARAQYEAAQNQLAAAKTNPNTEDIQLTNKQTEALIKQAQANLALLMIQLKNTRICAPASGVISARMAEEGEIVAPGAALFTILDTRRPWVMIYLPLKEVEVVSLHQKAYIMMDAYEKTRFYGRISFISQEAEFTPKDYQSKDERVKQVFAVKIRIDRADRALKAGMPVDVVIQPEE
ncbi:MAG: HlyD family secretion protein [Bacillota bacterium]